MDGHATHELSIDAYDPAAQAKHMKLYALYPLAHDTVDSAASQPAQRRMGAGHAVTSADDSDGE